MIDVIVEEIHNIWCKWAKQLLKEENLKEERIKRRIQQCQFPI